MAFSDLRRNYMVQCEYFSAMRQYKEVGYLRFLNSGHNLSVV